MSTFFEYNLFISWDQSIIKSPNEAMEMSYFTFSFAGDDLREDT